MYDKLIKAVESFEKRATEIRRHLHSIPEPSFSEEKTSSFVLEVLRESGISARSGLCGTGIIADLGKGDPEFGSVVLRADMDALPIREETDVPYRSTNKGYTHACGHDGHTASLLGTAMVLASLHGYISGRVRLLFQPAEEIAQGAKGMIEAGALEEKPDAVIALHAWPAMAEDTVASLPGVVTASNDAFTVQFRGQGGHGARPALARNPLLGMARLIEAVESMSQPDRVVSICVAKAGEKDNIIPDTSMVAGTLRALSRTARDELLAELEATVNEVAEGANLTAKLLLQVSCPEVSNDPDLYRLFRRVGSKLDGEIQTERLPSPSLGAEDFGHFTARVPGFFFRVGMGVDSWQLHTSRFDYHDAAIRSGMLVLSGMALEIAANPRGIWRSGRS